MSTPLAATVVTPEARRPRLRLWELVLVWLVLVAMALNAVSVAYLVAANWAVVVDGVGVGALRVWVFLMPILGLAAAVLLVRRSKWALPAFAAHVVASFAYTTYFHGLASVPWYFWLGYVAELLILCFCIRLLGRGAIT